MHAKPSCDLFVWMNKKNPTKKRAFGPSGSKARSKIMEAGGILQNSKTLGFCMFQMGRSTSGSTTVAPNSSEQFQPPRFALTCIVSNLHAYSIWTAKPSPCSGGHPHGLGDDHLVHDRNLAARQTDITCPSTILHLGIACDGFANEYYLDGLGEIMNRRIRIESIKVERKVESI